MKAMLPELALPRHNQMPGIREPGLWVRASTQHNQPNCTALHSCTVPLDAQITPNRNISMGTALA